MVAQAALKGRAIDEGVSFNLFVVNPDLHTVVDLLKGRVTAVQCSVIEIEHDFFETQTVVSERLIIIFPVPHILVDTAIWLVGN